MLKDYEINKPVLETDRLIIRPLTEADVPDLKEWLGRDEIYTYWGLNPYSKLLIPRLTNKDHVAEEKLSHLEENGIRLG